VVGVEFEDVGVHLENENVVGHLQLRLEFSAVAALKQRVFDNTFAAFNELKETLFEMASEMDDELDGKLDRPQ